MPSRQQYLNQDQNQNQNQVILQNQPQPNLPPFHPDHPHNRQNPYPLSSAHPNIPRKQSSVLGNGSSSCHASSENQLSLGVGAEMFVAASTAKMTAAPINFASDEVMSDSDVSSASPSPATRRRCFCGREVEKGEGEGEGGIYCSVACARSDAFSSLCYKPGLTQAAPITHSRQPSLASSFVSTTSSLARHPSTSSASTTFSNTSINSEDWTASHYRRLARADLRREERREERRRRRAEGSIASSVASSSRGTMMSTSSISSSRVPDLIGGAGHSRNASTASSRTSLSSSTWSSIGSLSRNPSSASSASSRRGYGGGVNVDAVIMEDDDEEEYLTGDSYRPYTQSRKEKKRAGSVSRSKKSNLDAFGMGKDMRDVLEEIIMMEKGFVVDDEEGIENGSGSTSSSGNTGLFTATFDRPPRTPSPVANERCTSGLLAAPGAPDRGHRRSLSQPIHMGSPDSRFRQISNSTTMSTNIGNSQRSSLMGLHQSSLSESHTALYLATASPVISGKRSGSPVLEQRRSMTFTPKNAGPALLGRGLPLAAQPQIPFAFGASLASPSLSQTSGSMTPSRRRPNISPTAHHPAMDNWRFPSPAISSQDHATPTHRQQQHSNAGSNVPFPRKMGGSDIEPHLLWPPPPPNLAPSLFPSSPATGTPEFVSALTRRNGRTSHPPSHGGVGQPIILAPSSGLRLGVLLGSGDDEDIDMDEGGDDDSTAHGHGLDDTRGYLPVFLEAEGFQGRRW